MEIIQKREAWNKGKFVGQKPPLKPKDIWAIRIHLQNAYAVRDLAMFNLAIDSNDPRYLYGYDDIHGHISIHSDYYDIDKIRKSDQILLESFGFCFDP